MEKLAVAKEVGMAEEGVAAPPTGTPKGAGAPQLGTTAVVAAEFQSIDEAVEETAGVKH